MSLSNKLTRTIVDYSNPKSIAFQFRSKRIANLIKIILQVYEQKGSVKILDIGGTKLYWRILSEHILEKYKVHITIANLPGTELAPAENHYKFIHADGCNLDTFPDNSFDVVHANSVIEHVGDWNNMLKFATEVQRVAPNLYIQTPYFWFPIEPHFMCPFFHWFPRPVRIALIYEI